MPICDSLISSALKHDAGKPPAHLLPPEVLRTIIRNDCDYAHARALQCWAAGDSVDLDARVLALTHMQVINVARVLDYGSKLYGPRNWEKGLQFSRVAAAGIRHAIAAQIAYGDGVDSESGMPHRWHLHTNVVFAYALSMRFTGTRFDDRPKGDSGNG